MCTAISFKAKEHLFGRNLDLDRSYGEKIAVMPRCFPLDFRKNNRGGTGYAIIGMSTVVERSDTRSYKEYGGLPLFYDAMNERGLAAAGLNFPYNAYYVHPDKVSGNKYCVAPFELIPWVLRQCGTVKEARKLLMMTEIADIPFSNKTPNTPLHWMFSDACGDLVVEQTQGWMNVCDNPVGVLTNNPPFDRQLDNLKRYDHLKTYNPEGLDTDKIGGCSSYSYGLGALGLPGDVSSASRFVRASFGRKNSASDGDELSSVGQIFHLLSSVEVVRGTCKTDEGKEHFTVYSSCMDTARGRYYYVTYGSRQITCVDMYKCDLDCQKVSRFDLMNEESIFFQN